MQAGSFYAISDVGCSDRQQGAQLPPSTSAALDITRQPVGRSHRLSADDSSSGRPFGASATSVQLRTGYNLSVYCKQNRRADAT
jgi:hypothetical protein